MANGEKLWRDEEVLKKKYWDEGKSCYEVAEELGCGYQTVLNWLHKFGLGSRKSTREKPPHFGTVQGYERVSCKIDGKTKVVLVHRLVAVAHGMLKPSDMFGSDIEVHHKNGVRFDNRPSNITTTTKENHMREHIHKRERDSGGRVT